MAWVDACSVEEIETEDAIRFDHGGRSYAIFATDEGDVFCTDGWCSHDGAHLAGGLVEGTLIECPDQGCLFDIRTGAPKGAPARGSLGTYPVQIVGDRIELDLPE